MPGIVGVVGVVGVMGVVGVVGGVFGVGGVTGLSAHLLKSSVCFLGSNSVLLMVLTIFWSIIHT